MEIVAWSALMVIILFFPASTIPESPWTFERMIEYRRALLITLIFLAILLAM